MSESNSPQPSGRDELAGVTFHIEAPEKVNVPPRDLPKSPAPRPEGHLPPTREELAGVYIYIEAPEKTYPPKQPPPPPATT